MRPTRATLPILLTLSVLLSTPPAEARPAERTPAAAPEVAVPEPLRPWVGWVLHDKEAQLCPALLGSGEDGARCVWPTSLDLALDRRGGRFTGRWRLFARGTAVLPGDGKAWPQDVRVDGRPAVVVPPPGDDEGRPAVLLAPGDHTITGAFLWDELPASLAVPQEIGLLGLSVGGERLALPLRDKDGRLFLHPEARQEEEDVLEVTVHRKLTDEIPLLLTTRIALRIAGKGREVVLARPLPPGFVPMSLESPLTARLQPDGRLRVQARTGNFTLVLLARHEG